MTLAEGELFISDLGENKEISVDGQPARLVRYAAIKSSSNGQFRVVEVSSDLQHLLEKYGLEKQSIGRVTHRWK